MFRLVILGLFIAAFSCGLIQIELPEWSPNYWVDELTHMGTFYAMEPQFSANQIMEKHKRELLRERRQKILHSSLLFYPFALLEIKYSKKEDVTQEGLMVWDLSDGELVLDGCSWEKTHGCEDCINASAGKAEFHILNALAARGGGADKTTLLNALKVEERVLDNWIARCSYKELIVSRGNSYRLHIENPRLKFDSTTRWDGSIVPSSKQEHQRVPPRYSPAQVENLVKAACGDNFSVRKKTLIYVPVHVIVVENGDQTTSSTYWNALNGKPFRQNSYSARPLFLKK